jgi:hypothetical protein
MSVADDLMTRNLTMDAVCPDAAVQGSHKHSASQHNASSEDG